jgi:hypothetical protein
MIEEEQEISDLLASFAYDPLGYVVTCWEWGSGELAPTKGPRKWQADILGLIGEHLRNPQTRYKPLRIAVSSGHGIGKSALCAFVTKWALGTCPDARVVITANTESQLSTKTSPELSKWFRLAIDSHAWNPRTTDMEVRPDPVERIEP